MADIRLLLAFMLHSYSIFTSLLLISITSDYIIAYKKTIRDLHPGLFFEWIFLKEVTGLFHLYLLAGSILAVCFLWYAKMQHAVCVLRLHLVGLRILRHSE